jgi:Holliday junction resolvasome RuvABC endonuclease subunit
MKRKKKNKYGFVTLCLDPSFTAFGWAVLRGNEVIDSGCIITKPMDKKLRIRVGDDRVRRVKEINNILKSIIQKHYVCFILSELPHGSQSAPAASALGMVTAQVQTISDMLDIGIEWYSENDSKKAVLGKSSATKSEMVDKIDKLYEVDWQGVKYIDEAVADAIAVHYTAKQNSSIIKHMIENE